MATSFLVATNRAFSKLAAAVNGSTTTFTVTAGQGANFPSTYPFHLTVEDEIVSVTNRSTDTLTVVRAQQGTSAATHPTKVYIALHITAKSITDLNTAVNTLEAYDVLTTRGDMIYRAASAPARLAKGADNTMLAMGANDPEWKTPAAIMGDLSGQAAAAFDFNAQDVKNIAVLQVNGATAAAYSRIGGTSSSHSLTSPNDLLISGKLEVEGMSFLDGGLDLSGLESAGAITIKPSGDADDYFTFATLTNVPTLYGTGAYLRIGDAGTTAHTLNAEDDLMVTGELEVKGITYLDGALNLADNLFIAESASADADVAAFGQFWVKNNTPNEPWYTGDDGVDHPLLGHVYPLANTYISGSGTAGSDNTAETVKTVVVPANTLTEVGDRLRVRVYFRGDTGAAVTMTATLNTVTIASQADGGGTTWFMTETWLHYIDSTHANIAETGAGAELASSAANSAGFDWTSAQDMDCDQDQVAGNHIVVYAIFLDVYPKGLI